MSTRGGIPYLPKRDAGVTARNLDDPYRSAAKPPEPTECPECHAVFTEGRWTWEKADGDVNEQLCPACQRRFLANPLISGRSSRSSMTP